MTSETTWGDRRRVVKELLSDRVFRWLVLSKVGLAGFVAAWFWASGQTLQGWEGTAFFLVSYAFIAVWAFSYGVLWGESR